MAKWVWDNRDWVQFDPNNTRHKDLPQYDYGWTKTDNSIPYYGTDVASLLMQYAFPGAAAAQTFGSMFLEPERQRAIKQLLGAQDEAIAGQTFGAANTAADNYQKSLNQGAMQNAKQSGASLYGSGGGGRQFQASNLLSNMNRANEAGSQFRFNTADPRKIAMERAGLLGNRYQTLLSGFQSPMLNNVAQFIPGLEQQRQNGSFFGNLLNTGLQLWGGGAFGGGRPNFTGGGVRPTYGSLGGF